MPIFKSDYLVVETYHERYSFTQDFYYCKNTTIEDVLKEYSCYDANTGEREKINNHNNIGIWTVDRSCDSTKIYDEEHLPYIRKHIESMTIIDLRKLKKEEFMSNIFCQTKTKFGMFDCDEGKCHIENRN